MYLEYLLNFTMYDLFFYFVIYSFFGWCTEVIYAAYSRHQFVNRGFLNGPFCPIYGFGALILIVLLSPIKSNLFLLFILSVLLTSLLEYITGYILEKAFNTTWWDYSDDAFNIHGRICLSFSILWGIVSVIVVKLIHPLIKNMVDAIPHNYGIIFYYLLILYFFIDFTVTLISLIELRKILTQLNDISKELKLRYSNLKDKAMEKAEDLEISIKELKSKYENVINNIKFKHIRILKAFPDVSSKNFDSIIKEIQNKIRFKK